MNRIIPFFLGSAFAKGNQKNMQSPYNQNMQNPYNQGFYQGPYQPMPYNPMVGEYPPYYPPYPYVRR